MMTPGKRIRNRRKALGLSQEKLAKLVETTQGQISKIEAAESNPPSDLLAKLAAELGVSTDWLLGLTESRAIQEGQQLSDKEQEVVSALREGDPLHAIKLIVLDEE